MRYIDDGAIGQVQFGLVCHLAQLGFGCDQHWLDQAGAPGVQRAAQAECIAGMHHGHGHRFHAFYMRDQALDAA